MLEKLIWSKEGFKTEKDDKPVDVKPIGQPMWVVFDDKKLFALDWDKRIPAMEEKINRYAEMHRYEFDAYCRDPGTISTTIQGGKDCRIFHFSVQLYKIIEKETQQA